MKEEDVSEEDVFTILLTTDNHLGYGEKKPLIDQDSFRSFEEALQIAVKQDVDMILLAGDLFHDVQPSNHTVYRCAELLKRYCFGDKSVEIELLSDPSESFITLKDPVANFDDPNLNISIPVFSIHGNHDNPSGCAQISGLDILASSGLVNYFGRWTNLTSVTVKPILLKKGSTKIALYGLSHMPDHRLSRLFRDKKVFMMQPDGGGWFHILVLHQNRANRGAKNYIPTEVIPKFINLVVWGHEHDCDIVETMLPHGPYITQPGSTVATSLCEGESMQKHVGILKIYHEAFKIEPIPLVTVRPLMFCDVVLKCPDDDDYNKEKAKEQAMDDVRAKVMELLEQAKVKQLNDGTNVLAPFIRLIVKYYSDEQVFNANRMGYEYEETVANFSTMFKLTSIILKKRDHMQFPLDPEIDKTKTIDDFMTEYFKDPDCMEEMSILSLRLMSKAVQQFVDAGDNEAISYAIELQEKATLDKLIEMNPNLEDVDTCLQQIKQAREQDEDQEISELIQKLNTSANQRRPTASTKTTSREEEEEAVEIQDSDDGTDNNIGNESAAMPAVSPAKPVRGRGSRGARTRTAGTTRGRRSRRAAQILP